MWKCGREILDQNWEYFPSFTYFGKNATGSLNIKIFLLPMITASMTPYAMQSLESSPSGLYTPITMTTTTQKTVRAARTMKSHTIHGRMNQCLHWKSKGNLIKIMMPSAAPNIRGRAGQPTTPIPCGLIPPCIHPSYGKTRVGAREEGREGACLVGRRRRKEDLGAW